ncbi:hypothetical protein KFL_004530160 [Klebsormidium nitens]|uniref:Uncharacterized protein n=1 Tax=Klebsormidium nitens TaxID=105231 RepID=A0A1Y1II15_KLENI|nr:hypothetical protein KFL_004530160 [Klebsormidium nitens]|eukprot:GAQ88711.1 hypothetical protein KFL_004530160 [Klebsormidium nitens]
MGLTCSQLAPSSWQDEGDAADGISPNDLQKGGPNLESLGEVTAAPSVVIGWVLRDVIGWPSIFQATDITEEKLKVEVKTEVHVARLLRCWEEHGEAFPEAFVQELSLLVTSFQAEDCTSETTSESGIPQRLLVTYEDLWKRDLQTEAHAARLRKCWDQYGDAFPKAFAEELSVFAKSLQEEDIRDNVAGKNVRVATLLAQVFASQNASFHVTRRSQEL